MLMMLGTFLPGGTYPYSGRFLSRSTVRSSLARNAFPPTRTDLYSPLQNNLTGSNRPCPSSTPFQLPPDPHRTTLTYPFPVRENSPAPDNCLHRPVPGSFTPNIPRPGPSPLPDPPGPPASGPCSSPSSLGPETSYPFRPVPGLTHF